eukprot:CAMPEP_0119380754 /NCGR_PEP_ID=MMETSP1334-20130426/57906_1 /TAXON_ID=127549 /ORGANISM="Calcidiscus leptoporus, Strain RCC1130" /LENGTH=194 /DNA_ID=CAMNT_0007400685 /DNA_START=18 /DNA_END=602 /DNA_ORIENTATION=+
MTARSPTRFGYAATGGAPATVFVTGGRRGADKQTVCNPGRLTRYDSVQETISLRAQVQTLARRVAVLEVQLSKASDAQQEKPLPEVVAAMPAAADACAETYADLNAVGDVLSRPQTARPSSANYRCSADTASHLSWSADAFGRSKTPGWYHLHRKQIMAHRQKLAKQEPDGCYVSHTKYADEAVRISSTGRLAF